MQLQEYVAKVAYKRWQRRGSIRQNDLADWFAAEKEVPKKIVLGWKPALSQGRYDYSRMEPSIANWFELFHDPRYRHLFGDETFKGVATAGWLDETHYMHYTGVQDFEEAPVERVNSLLWPSEDELKDRQSAIRFHGPVFILWLMATRYGTIQNLRFIVVKHRDTIWEEIPIGDSESRCNHGKINDFPVGVRWAGSKYDLKYQD